MWIKNLLNYKEVRFTLMAIAIVYSTSIFIIPKEVEIKITHTLYHKIGSDSYGPIDIKLRNY